MTQQIPLLTLIVRPYFFLITTFIIAMCLSSLMANPTNALEFDNSTQLSNYFQRLPVNQTDKFTMLILFADLIHDKISNTVETLEISSRDESLKNVPFIKNVSSDHNGIRSTLDLDKRNLAKDILQRNKDIASIFFVLPNGDIYMGEPYRDQEQLPRINFADREWYKGVVKNDQTYISSIFLSASINAPAIAVAVPVYSQKSDSNIQTGSSSLSGYWVGIINLKSLADLLEGLPLNNENRFILIDHNGSELLDTNKSKIGPSYSSSLDNTSSLSSDSNMTYQVKLETFDHFNLINEFANEPRPVFIKDNLDDQKLMFWKSIKIKDSNWHVVLITMNDS